MNIKVLHCLKGAQEAEGLTVIIDVFRAFSLECYLYSMGAESIYPAGSLDEARALKEEHPQYVLIGERGGKKCEGFDFGNSPSTIPEDAIRGKCVIHTTSSGTQGVTGAVHADEIITGSMVNARAVAAYIKQKHPKTVSIVAMGTAGIRENPEDELCAQYIKSLLEDRPLADIEQRLFALRTNGGEHFFDRENQDVYPEGDFWACIRHDIFPFVIEVLRRDEGLYTRVHMI